MPSDPKDELAIQFIIAQIKTISTPTYHTAIDANNVDDNFKNPLSVLKETGDSGFPLVQVVGPHNITYGMGHETQGGEDWSRIGDVQAGTEVEIYTAVLGLDSRSQILRLRDDIIRVLSNDFSLGGNIRNWEIVSLQAGYAWDKQSSYMGTAVMTLQLTWTYKKTAP